MSSARATKAVHILQSTYDTPNVFKKLVLPRKYTMIFHRDVVDLHIGPHYLKSADSVVVTGKWHAVSATGYEIRINGPAGYSKEAKSIINSVDHVLQQYTTAKLIYNSILDGVHPKRKSTRVVKDDRVIIDKKNKRQPTYSKPPKVVNDNDTMTVLIAMDKKNKRQLTYGKPRMCKACHK